MKAKDILLVALALLFVFYVALPVAKGSLKFLIVLSGSMVPVMQVGDIIVVQKEAPQEVRFGDILAFKDPRGTPNVIITHRVIGINQGGSLSFQTKGDAVEDPDTFTVKADEVIGKAVFSLPSLGYLVEYAKRPAAFLLFNIFPAALLIAGEVRKIRLSDRPGLALRHQRSEQRKKRVLSRLDYRRLFLVFFVSFLAFGALSLPFFFASGDMYAEGGTKVVNNGPAEGLFFFRPGKYVFVPPEVVAGKSGASLRLDQPAVVSVAAAPFIMPAMWIEVLSRASPLLPSLVSAFAPPLLISLALYPLCVKRHRGGIGIFRVFKRWLVSRLYIYRSIW